MGNIIVAAIEKIIFIPRDFHLLRTKSWNNLVQESGYIQLSNKITENDIAQYLRQNPQLISQWLQWSEDQRCSPAITFEQGESKRYYVKRYPESEHFKEFNSMDAFEACAKYIMKQLEDTANYTNL